MKINILFIRTFWNNFKGFPKMNAKLAYCFLVNELVGGTEINLMDSEKSSGTTFERVGGTISTLKYFYYLFIMITIIIHYIAY